MTDRNTNLFELLRRKHSAEVNAAECSLEKAIRDSAKKFEVLDLSGKREKLLKHPLVAEAASREEISETAERISHLTEHEYWKKVKYLNEEIEGWDDPKEYFWNRIPEVGRILLAGFLSMAGTCFLILLIYQMGFSLEAVTDEVGSIMSVIIAVVCTVLAGGAGALLGYGITQDSSDEAIAIIAGAFLSGTFTWSLIWDYLSGIEMSPKEYLLADGVWAALLFIIFLILNISLDIIHSIFAFTYGFSGYIQELVWNLYADLLDRDEGEELLAIVVFHNQLLPQVTCNSWKKSTEAKKFISYYEEIRILEGEIERLQQMET